MRTSSKVFKVLRADTQSEALSVDVKFTVLYESDTPTFIRDQRSHTLLQFLFKIWLSLSLVQISLFNKHVARLEHFLAKLGDHESPE